MSLLCVIRTEELDDAWWTSLNLVKSVVAGNLPESTLKVGLMISISIPFTIAYCLPLITR